MEAPRKGRPPSLAVPSRPPLLPASPAHCEVCAAVGCGWLCTSSRLEGGRNWRASPRPVDPSVLVTIRPGDGRGDRRKFLLSGLCGRRNPGHITVVHAGAPQRPRALQELEEFAKGFRRVKEPRAPSWSPRVITLRPPVAQLSSLLLSGAGRVPLTPRDPGTAALQAWSRPACRGPGSRGCLWDPRSRGEGLPTKAGLCRPLVGTGSLCRDLYHPWAALKD